jgi:hypothetical protein
MAIICVPATCLVPFAFTPESTATAATTAAIPRNMSQLIGRCYTTGNCGAVPFSTLPEFLRTFRESESAGPVDGHGDNNVGDLATVAVHPASVPTANSVNTATANLKVPWVSA